MESTKKIKLEHSRLYGFKLLTTGCETPVNAKVGGKVPPKHQPGSVVLGSKIGQKIGVKVN